VTRLTGESQKLIDAILKLIGVDVTQYNDALRLDECRAHYRVSLYSSCRLRGAMIDRQSVYLWRL